MSLQFLESLLLVNVCSRTWLPFYFSTPGRTLDVIHAKGQNQKKRGEVDFPSYLTRVVVTSYRLLPALLLSDLLTQTNTGLI